MTPTTTHIPPDVSIGYRLEVGTTVTFVCAVVVVSLRMVARSIYAKMSWDDYLMLFALVKPPKQFYLSIYADIYVHLKGPCPRRNSL
jgi:hypothetical protein